MKMSFICEWGKPTCNMNDEAKKLFAEYKTEKTDMSRRNELLRMIYNITDTRMFCVVIDCTNNLIRHIVRVTDEAETRLEDFKKEYYLTYTQAQHPSDRFYFFRGFHRATEFTDTLNLTNYTIEEIEKAYLETVEEEFEII